MKPMHSADENRQLAEVQIEKAAKPQTGSTKESHLKKRGTMSRARIRTIGGTLTFKRPTDEQSPGLN